MCPSPKEKREKGKEAGSEHYKRVGGEYLWATQAIDLQRHEWTEKNIFLPCFPPQDPTNSLGVHKERLHRALKLLRSAKSLRMKEELSLLDWMRRTDWNRNLGNNKKCWLSHRLGEVSRHWLGHQETFITKFQEAKLWKAFWELFKGNFQDYTKKVAEPNEVSVTMRKALIKSLAGLAISLICLAVVFRHSFFKAFNQLKLFPSADFSGGLRGHPNLRNLNPFFSSSHFWVMQFM